MHLEERNLRDGGVPRGPGGPPHMGITIKWIRELGGERKIVRKLFVFVMALMTLAPIGAQQGKGEWLAYIGTYTRGKAKGIYAYRFQPATGEVKEIGLAAESTSPTFLAVHPNQR